MKGLETRQTSKYHHKTLRNGKILIPRKTKMEKKITIKAKNNIQLPLEKIKIDRFKVKLNSVSDINKNDIPNVKVSNNTERILNGRKLYIVLTKLPLSIGNRESSIIDDQNNNYSRNGYKKLENFINYNEIQIYNNHEFGFTSGRDKYPKNSQSISLPILQNGSSKKKVIKQKKLVDEQINERITRGKIIKQKTEERKQLDKIMFDKFPKDTFKKLDVQLNDISKEVKFLSTLGLRCRCKCPLTNGKIRRT
ncbi:uncharacterized protein LOC126899092 [Daktulosphaira vitifoliae]|uniref:uncharacterized protein LOC126899092 n=1 Tax=Daktulosphaira vitifoliae TaxID=58002 RepID=UPI0021AA755F|nr:uncharacterized protein LOC126899092 [Daktulosphaira vitifoliae]